MNRRHLLFPLLGTGLLWVAFAGFVWLTAAQLPERVATHFGAHGEPNGWMSRSEHVQFTLMMGVAVPAFVLGIFSVMGRFPQALNMAHKEYWLAPERREETMAWDPLESTCRHASLSIL